MVEEQQDLGVPASPSGLRPFGTEPAPQSQAEPLVPNASDFAPCPVCRQYSHSIGRDQLAKAFMHFQSMFSHRGDGIPTQFCFSAETRDAAQVLMAAVRVPGGHSDAEADNAETLGRLYRQIREQQYACAEVVCTYPHDGNCWCFNRALALFASGIEGEAGDPKGLHPEGESPAPPKSGETPETSPESSQ